MNPSPAQGGRDLLFHEDPAGRLWTFASILFALGRELPVAMDQIGHSDPRMTLTVYAGSCSVVIGSVIGCVRWCKAKVCG